MNEKTGTGVSSEKEKVKESQSGSVTPLLDTPLGVGFGASHVRSVNSHSNSTMEVGQHNYGFCIKFSPLPNET